MDLAKVNDYIPSEVEVEAAVHHLRPHKVESLTSTRYTSNSGQGRRILRRSERTPPNGALDVSVRHLQHMWRTGKIPQELGWTVLFLIPKGTNYTRFIGLIDTLWKVLEVIIDTRLRSSLQMHDVLHRFRDRRGTRTAIMELKLAQELSSIDHDPLFLVFLDLMKAYDTLDREHLLMTLEGYGAGPGRFGLLETFWSRQQVVPIHNGFHGPDLPATRGTTKCGLVSPTLFNVVVDNVIRTCLYITVEEHRVAHDGLEDTVGRCLGVFYADDGMVISRYVGWLKHSMNFIVSLF